MPFMCQEVGLGFLLQIFELHYYKLVRSTEIIYKSFCAISFRDRGLSRVAVTGSCPLAHQSVECTSSIWTDTI